MKKTLLSFVMLVFAMFTASAQTNLIENGDFETWAEGAPVNWKSTTTASSAVLEETTDAHSGAKAVLVKGASSNKRLAYKELDLKAGTYKMTFFVKAATAEGGSARPGYVPVKADGSVDGNGYKYGDYSNELTAEWREVIHEFTLAADTKVNILVMNPKKPGKDIIIDDFSLTTTDGGSGEGGGEVKPEPQPEPQPEEVIFSETFAKDQGAFTIDNKVVPEGVTVWTHADYNGKAYMKATAFVKGQGGADAESWLVSPVIDLTKQTEATLSFDQAANFFKGFDGFNVKVKAEGGEWANLEVANNAKGDSWNFVTSTADLKAFCGKKVQIAFVYTSAVATTGTWEVMNVKVTKKAGEVKPEPQPEPQPEEALYSADFSADMCGFTIENKKLTGGLTEVWKHDVNYKQMKGTATVKEGKDFIKNEAESWVISPVIDLAKAKNANLSFTSIANFFNDQATFAASCFVKVKVEGQAEWTNVVVEGLPDGKSWGKVTSTADLKAFDGKKIQLAFVYTSTTEVAGTWEFTNVKIANKAGEVNPDPQPQPEATVYTTIAELKKNAAEKAAKVTFKFNDLLVAAKVYDNLYLTDGKEAFMTYGSKNTFNVGDKISGEFTGDLVSFKGTIEFKNVDFAATKVASSNNTIPAKDVTLAQLADANNFGALQSMWVRVKGVKVDSAAFNSNKNINMVDGTHTVVLRDKTGAAAKFAFDTKATYDFYGVVDMFGGKMQIALLSDEDIEMVSTGIEGVEAEKGEDVIYDLAGRRVAKATKGLFIINGVKTFVK